MVGVGVLGKGKVGIGRKGWGMEKGLGGAHQTHPSPPHPCTSPHTRCRNNGCRNIDCHNNVCIPLRVEYVPLFT